MPKGEKGKTNSKELKENVISYLKTIKSKKSITERQICNKFSSKYTKNEILKTLHMLVGEGVLNLNGTNKFSIKIVKIETTQRKAIKKTMVGVLDMTKGGSGYLIPDEGGEDIFISRKNINRAFNQDRVQIEITKHSGRREGVVTEIIERNRSLFIGEVDKRKHCFVRLDDPTAYVDFFIPDEEVEHINHRDKVVVKFLSWSSSMNHPLGKITEVLGRSGDNDVEMKSLLVENGFYLKFSKQTIEEANKLSNELSEEEIASRRDFRNITTFTIDPLDAKDFDDAISIRKIDKDKWEIGVHIADVSHYAREGSALDQDALKRGTSVYLVDRVAPMFPEQLSNIVCSLRPNEEKCCFSAVFEMNNQAQVSSRWFGKTLICSDKRFVYEEAQDIIERKEGPFHQELEVLNHLAQQMRARRFRNGSVNFDSKEVKFKLDEHGKPIGVYIKEQKDAHKLVEDFMLLANREVAYFVGKEANANGKNAFIYRVHDQPDMEKLKDFSLFARSFGYQLNLNNPKTISQDLNNLLIQLEGKPEESLLQQLAIRCMAKAVYSTKNIGHYGLGFEYYTHFTSPIRRYPDVMVHRILEQVLRGKSTPSEKDLEIKAQFCSERERAAMFAERDSIKYKMVEYMEDKVGQVFLGVISGVKTWGVYVELPEFNTEGMISLQSFSDDNYIVDEKKMMLKGVYTDKKYVLGDKTYVKLTKVDKFKKTIDFDLSTQTEYQAQLITEKE